MQIAQIWIKSYIFKKKLVIFRKHLEENLKTEFIKKFQLSL